MIIGRLALGLIWIFVWPLHEVAAIEPPEDAASVGYNYYDGGDITVQGPAVIVRKNVMNRITMEAAYRVDMISSASIDVVTQASRRSYEEDRKEYTVGLGFYRGDALIGLNYTNSRESDYESDTLAVGIAQDIFNKNITLNLKVARSWDRVGKNNDPSFGWKDFNRTAYGLGWAQTLSHRWLLQLNYELTADEGFINNPYRSALTEDGGWIPEEYPDARTGHAWVARTSFAFLPRIIGDEGSDSSGGLSSLQLEYRYYQDSFDIQAHTARIRFQQYVFKKWLLNAFYQYYAQDEASFYGDKVPSNQNYVSRDKELSQFNEHGIGFSVKYRPGRLRWSWIQEPYFQLGYTYLIFEYENFTDPRTGELYDLQANVIHTSLGFNF